MTTYREQLEGAELFRIRRIKRLTIVLLFVLAVSLSVYGMAIEGASVKPFYLPIAPFFAVGSVFLLIGAFANLAFRTLEIRYARRESQKYLLVKNSIRSAMPVVVLGLALGLVLVVPWTHQAIEASLDAPIGAVIAPSETRNYTFASTDAFGLAPTRSGTLIISGQANARLDLEYFNGESTQFMLDLRGTVTLDVPDFGGVKELRLSFRNPGNRDAQVQLTWHHTVAVELSTILPVVLLSLAILNAAWVVYARPLRKQFSTGSIYSVRYVEEAGVGERTYADYYRARAPIAPAATPPPPPPPMPVAAPLERVPIVPALASAAPAPPPPPPEVAAEPAPVEPEANLPAILEEGSRLFSDGRFEEALAKFDEALEIEPENVQALLAGAVALLRLGRRDEALGNYDRVLQLDPRNPKAYSGRAQLYEAERGWAQAADAWASYLAIVPGDIDARLRRAECVVNTGDRAGAVRILEEALFLAPSDPRIRAHIDALTVNVPQLLSKALVASASGRYEEALADLDTILAVDPDNVNALVGRGVALRRADRKDEALQSFEVALAKQPGNSAALRAKGAILEEKGDFEGALDVYDDLLAWSPRDPEVWALQGSVLEKLGEPEEALASYTEALKLDPNGEEWRKRAEALESSRKGQEAFLEELFTIKGVGPSRARALLAAGYKTRESVFAATEDQLASVRGMTSAIARDIYRHFHAELPPPPEPPPAPPPV